MVLESILTSVYCVTLSNTENGKLWEQNGVKFFWNRKRTVICLPSHNLILLSYRECVINLDLQVRAGASWRVDTGHFFNTSLIQGLVFKGIVKGQESKVWDFFKGLRSFRGPQKRKRKNNHNSLIFGSKIKVRSNFIWGKLMEFLLFNEVLKTLIFSSYPSKKLPLRH